jgi:hypothetical protein
MSQTSARRGPCAIRSIAADSSLPSPKPAGFSDKRASMNGAIEPDHASTMRFDDSAIVCHSFAHSRLGPDSAAADLSFSLIVLLAPKPRSRPVSFIDPGQAAARLPNASV